MIPKTVSHINSIVLTENSVCSVFFVNILVTFFHVICMSLEYLLGLSFDVLLINYTRTKKPFFLH